MGARPLFTRSALFLVAAGFLSLSCSDDVTSPTPQTESAADVIEFDGGPSQAADPTNSDVPPTGQCMGNDAVTYNENVDGFSSTTDPTAFNCTANDVRIANARASTGSGVLTCVEGDEFQADIVADVVETATSARTDIGIWIEDGDNGAGGAEDGTCDFFWFDESDISATGDAPFDLDGDECGDMENAATVNDFDLADLTLICPSNPVIRNDSTFVEVESCVSWTQPGGDRVCSDFDQSDAITGDGPRAGTLPANKSKCNCEPFLIPVRIERMAEVTVVKNLNPTDDPGLFQFTIRGGDSSVVASIDDASHLDSVKAQISWVSGTEPDSNRAIVEELIGSSSTTALSDYDTHYECVDRSSNMQTAIDSTAGTGPQAITLANGDDWLCTFTNQRIPLLQVKKVLDPTDDSGLFNLRIDGDTVFADASHNDSTGYLQVSVGQHTVSEVAGTSTDLNDYNSSVGGDCVAADPGTSSTVTLAYGDEKSCTIDNSLKRSKVIIKKVTDPTGLSDNFSFSQDIDASGNFMLADGDSAVFDMVLPGSYSVTEGDPTPGFDLTSLVCDDANSTESVATRTASIELEPDETVTCTFTNTQRGTVIIKKETDPDGLTDNFTFSHDVDASGNFMLADGDSTVFQNVAPGSYTVTESDPTPGFDLTSLTCTDTDTSGTDSDQNASNALQADIELDPGETVTCTFNNRQRGTVIIKKVTDPTGLSDNFTFSQDVDASGNFMLADGDSAVFQNVVTGSYTVTESDPTPAFDLTDLTCVDSDAGGTASSQNGSNALQADVELDPGETVTCTFTNTKRAMVTLNKYESGSPAAGYTFEIRTGASTSASGTVQATGTSDASGVVTFSCVSTTDYCENDASSIAKLVPGNYAVCETGMMAGWSNNITSPPGYTPDSETAEGGDNSVECVDVSLAAGQMGVPSEFSAFDPINNMPPPGGDARTIGYWKNWSSCSSGNQEADLDAKLASAGGILIGDLLVDTCEEGVRILDKSAISGNGRGNSGKTKKHANDAAYSLAAQLLAAELNFEAAAGTCAAANTAATDGQTLLADIDFDGTGNYLPPNVDELNGHTRSEALGLADTLDQYNNNELCP